MADSYFDQLVLRKRTSYHHRVSSLPLAELFQKVQFAGLMRQSHLESYLTDFGKEQMETLEKESRENLKFNVLQKARKTLGEVEAERVIGTLLRIIQYGARSLEDLKNMIGSFSPKALENLEKMKSAKRQLSAQDGEEKKG